MIAYLLSGHRSAIPTQLLQFTKAPALQASHNQEIGEIQLNRTEEKADERETGRDTLMHDL